MRRAPRRALHAAGGNRGLPCARADARTRRTGGGSRRCMRDSRTSLPSPVVRLNHAVAVGMAEGPAAALALVDALTAQGGAGELSLCAERARRSARETGPPRRGAPRVRSRRHPHAQCARTRPVVGAFARVRPRPGVNLTVDRRSTATKVETSDGDVQGRRGPSGPRGRIRMASATRATSAPQPCQVAASCGVPANSPSSHWRALSASTRHSPSCAAACCSSQAMATAVAHARASASRATVCVRHGEPQVIDTVANHPGERVIEIPRARCRLEFHERIEPGRARRRRRRRRRARCAIAGAGIGLRTASRRRASAAMLGTRRHAAASPGSASSCLHVECIVVPK